MANSETIKTTIDANINTNGNQSITGAVLNRVLNDMVDEYDANLAQLEEKIDKIESGQGNDARVDGETLVFGGSSAAQVIGETLKL